MRPNARPDEYDSITAMSLIRCAIARVRVAGDDHVDGALRQLADHRGTAPRRDRRSTCRWGDRTRVHLLPMCAVTMITCAPWLRSARACWVMIAAGGRTARSAKFAGIVVNGVDSVLAPMIPTLIPATSTIIDDGMFGHLIGSPLCLSTMFATRIGNFASRARALSAPRAIVLDRGRGHRGPLRPVVELVVADRRSPCSPSGCRRARHRRPRRCSTRACPGTCRRRRLAARRRHRPRAPRARWRRSRRAAAAARARRADRWCR